jgi:hypothetical protein
MLTALLGLAGLVVVLVVGTLLAPEETDGERADEPVPR